MSKEIMRRMKLIDWQLTHPEQIKIMPEITQPVSDLVESHCVQAWFIGLLPGWWSDLCFVLKITDYRCIASFDELPEIAPTAWVFVNGTESTDVVHGRVVNVDPSQLNYKKKIWEQICRYEP